MIPLHFPSPFDRISDIAWSLVVGATIVLISILINTFSAEAGWWPLLFIGLPLAVWGGSIIGHNLARYQSEKR